MNKWEEEKRQKHISSGQHELQSQEEALLLFSVYRHDMSMACTYDL
jgi:hypothetical protein